MADVRIIEPRLRSWYWFKLDADAVAYNSARAAINQATPTGIAQRIKLIAATTLLVIVASVSDNFREKTGNNDGMRVALAQMTVNGKDEFEAWCMAEVQSKIAFVEAELGVKSPFLATEHCMTLMRHAIKNKYAVLNYQDFQPGDTIIWEHGETDSGHTGIFIKWIVFGKIMLVSEGNTTAGLGPNGTIVREGGGGYIVQRAVGKIGDMNLRGAARPFPLAA